MTYDQVKKNIAKKTFSPIYYLYGEETYFTDKLIHLIDEHVLSQGERDFNAEIFYGGECSIGQILNACKSFPLMADRRLVIVKEAQSLGKKEWEKMLSYFQKPSKTTVLALGFKGKEGKLDKAAMKAIEANGVSVESKRMYDKDIRNWTTLHIADSGYEAEAGVVDVIVDYLGTNLGFIENELDKIFIVLSAHKQKKITKGLVYEMINIDKEFNVFELRKALSKKDVYQSQMIAYRLAATSKQNPLIVIISTLFRFFDNLLILFSKKAIDVKSIQTEIGANWFEAQDYAEARKRYNIGAVQRNIQYLLEADLTLKGMIPSDMEEDHILKTLVWKIVSG